MSNKAKRSLIAIPTSTFELTDSSEAAHEKSILTYWQPIVAAAGMHDARQDLFTIYNLGWAICKDAEVEKRTNEKVAAWRYSEDEKYPPGFKYTIQVLNAMTLEEKIALKERILAKNPHAVTAF